MHLHPNPPCPDCDGFGHVMERHPRYGEHDCPADLVEADCTRCHGEWDAELLCGLCDTPLRGDYCTNCEEASQGYWHDRRAA